MQLTRSAPGIEAILLRARAVVQTLDAALATLADSMPGLPPESHVALPAEAAARIRRSLEELEAELASLGDEYAEEDQEARSWAERARIAAKEGRADLVAQADRRHARHMELARQLEDEIGQLRMLRDRVSMLLEGSGTGGRRAGD